jgi:8-oxo-dGTP pyrophosphatase MutT (NUDIX family)
VTADLPRASVALIVRPERSDLELLLIRRAERHGDPWSGHMALPGGREDPGDADTLHTALRESHEEVGVALDHGQVLGRLDDVRPISGAPRICVAAWVFGVPAETGVRPNHEVDLAVWVPLQALTGPGATTEYLYALTSGETLRFPAFGYQDHVIWGLTHRILTQFLELARDAAGQGGVR